MVREGSADNPTPPDPGGAERRTDVRRPTSIRIVCYPTGAPVTERRQVRLRNVSIKGLALVADRRWEKGTELVVELPGADERTVQGRAHVVHSTPQLGGLFLIGCILDVPLTEAQITAMVSSNE